MFINRPYLPEGMNKSYQENASALLTLNDAKKYIAESTPLEFTINRCDHLHHLYGTIGNFSVHIARENAISPYISGADKEISILSLVGKYICGTITAVTQAQDGTPLLHISRKQLQEDALSYLLDTLHEGDVIPAVITSMSPIGIFADIGCGIIALLPIRQISVSRISHPSERFLPNQTIYCVVEKIDHFDRRFLLSHKELLGTWGENAAQFREGETVTGTVRGIKSYGIFIELSPNLTGLAEPDERLQEGDRVSVLIKSILPEKHKIKLHIVGLLPPCLHIPSLHYSITKGNIGEWSYFKD